MRTIHEHFNLSFHVPMGPLAEMTHALAQRPGDVNGPTTLDSRYVTEDVPFGLVPTIRLAALAGVPVPLHESGVRLMSALYGRDFAAENDILPRLGTLSAGDADRLKRDDFAFSRSARLSQRSGARAGPPREFGGKSSRSSRRRAPNAVGRRYSD